MNVNNFHAVVQSAVPSAMLVQWKSEPDLLRIGIMHECLHINGLIVQAYLPYPKRGSFRPGTVIASEVIAADLTGIFSN